MNIKKILKIRKYKAGYEVREELHDGSEYGCNDFVIKIAYTPEGYYIGDSKTAYRLCKKMGIKPILIDDSHNVCSIGWCEKEQKYYGWSHRAIYGFGIGSECKKGDCHYNPTDPEDLLEDMERFWLDDENHRLIQGIMDASDPSGNCPKLGVLIEYECPRKTDGKILNFKHWTPYPDIWGKGEWVAKTLDDAKQMAIDFAQGVS